MRDRPAYTACLSITGEGEGPTAPALPGFEQGVGEQGQCTRLRLLALFSSAVVQEQVDQSGLQAPYTALGGFLDRLAQFRSVHRANVFLPLAQRLA